MRVREKAHSKTSLFFCLGSYGFSCHFPSAWHTDSQGPGVLSIPLEGPADIEMTIDLCSESFVAINADVVNVQIGLAVP